MSKPMKTAYLLASIDVEDDRVLRYVITAQGAPSAEPGTVWSKIMEWREPSGFDAAERSLRSSLRFSNPTLERRCVTLR